MVVAEQELTYVCMACAGKRYESKDPSGTLLFSDVLGATDHTKSIFVGNAVDDSSVALDFVSCKCGSKLAKKIRVDNQRPLYICIKCKMVLTGKTDLPMAHAGKMGPPVN